MKKIVLYVGAFLFSIAGYAQQALWGGGDIVSPQINKDNSVTFRILAPKASKVETFYLHKKSRLLLEK